MLSATADHALRAVLFLARRPREVVTPAAEIADAIGAPRNYLSKTLNALTRAGLTASAPGRCGGYSLAMPADELTLHRVVSVFDDTTVSRRCLLGDRPCSGERPCAAHQRWTQIDRAHDLALKSTTIADLIRE